MLSIKNGHELNAIPLLLDKPESYLYYTYIYIIIHNIYIYTYISPRNVPITWLESTSPTSLLVRQPHICCQSFPCWDERLPVTQFFLCWIAVGSTKKRHEFFHSCLLGTSAQRKPAGPWQQYQTSGTKNPWFPDVSCRFSLDSCGKTYPKLESLSAIQTSSSYIQVSCHELGLYTRLSTTKNRGDPATNLRGYIGI